VSRFAETIPGGTTKWRKEQHRLSRKRKILEVVTQNTSLYFICSCRRHFYPASANAATDGVGIVGQPSTTVFLAAASMVCVSGSAEALAGEPGRQRARLRRGVRPLGARRAVSHGRPGASLRPSWHLGFSRRRVSLPVFSPHACLPSLCLRSRWASRSTTAQRRKDRLRQHSEHIGLDNDLREVGGILGGRHEPVARERQLRRRTCRYFGWSERLRGSLPPSCLGAAGHGCLHTLHSFKEHNRRKMLLLFWNKIAPSSSGERLVCWHRPWSCSRTRRAEPWCLPGCGRRALARVKLSAKVLEEMSAL